MGLLIGTVLAAMVGISATVVGLDRERAFYPTVTIVIASYYALFAVMGGSSHALLLESAVAIAFVAAAVVAFKSSLWLAVGALLAHGIFDFAHGHLIANPGVPSWWPAFCLAYDVVAGIYLAWLLLRGRVEPRATA